MALAGMGTGFITVSALKRWNIPDSTAGIFTIAFLVGQTLGYITFGFLADRRGHKLALELAILASTVGFALTWLAPGPEWYYAAFILFGIGSSAIIGSAMLMVMEFCAPERRPTYIGITSTSVGVVGIVAPLIGAGLASVNYDGLFAVCVAIDAVALILMRWWVREPRWNAEDRMRMQNDEVRNVWRTIIARHSAFMHSAFVLVVSSGVCAAQGDTPPPRPDPRFGIVEAFVNPDAAREAGAGFTRIILRWDVIQPGGPADWKPANVPDPFIARELADGRQVVGLLIGTPAWASADGVADARAVPRMDAWAAFTDGWPSTTAAASISGSSGTSRMCGMPATPAARGWGTRRTTPGC